MFYRPPLRQPTFDSVKKVSLGPTLKPRSLSLESLHFHLKVLNSRLKMDCDQPVVLQWEE